MLSILITWCILAARGALRWSKLEQSQCPRQSWRILAARRAPRWSTPGRPGASWRILAARRAPRWRKPEWSAPVEYIYYYGEEKK